MTKYYAQTDVLYRGGEKIFSIPFSYIKKEHIKVFIDNIETTNFSFNSSSQILISDTINEGQIVSIKRDTPIDERMVTFSDTSILKKETQNLAQEQIFDALQEMSDDNSSFKQNIDAEVAIMNERNENAETLANRALSTANSADSKADNAVAIANSAESKATASLATANSANSKADSAISTANTAATTANSADSKADSAVITANSANSNAETAMANAQTAISNSAQAITTASTAADDAETALSTANTAAINASTALSNSQTALTNSSEALSTANSANTLSAQASNKVDSFESSIDTVLEAADKINDLEEAVESATQAAETVSGLADTITAKADEAIAAVDAIPTTLSGFIDDLGSNPVHTHSQYLTSHQDISGKADVNHTHNQYLTSHQDISGKENITNKVTAIDSNSTDTQYPSAKCVYDALQNTGSSINISYEVD